MLRQGISMTLTMIERYLYMLPTCLPICAFQSVPSIPHPIFNILVYFFTVLSACRRSHPSRAVSSASCCRDASAPQRASI